MLVVDRIEGSFAVCERPDRSMVNIPLTELPDGLREGDCLRELAEGYVIDPEETAKRRKRSSDLFKRLVSRGEKE